MEVKLEGTELPTPMFGLALRWSLNLPGSKNPKRLVTSATYILEHGNEKESTDSKCNFNAYVTMEVN